MLVGQVSLQSATPCIRIFPATMALAKNFQGYAAFGRLIGDSSQESRQLLKDLNIKEVRGAPSASLHCISAWVVNAPHR